MKILGLDPGLRVTGYGVIEKNGSTLTYVSSGCIKSPDGELPDRLKNILNSVQEVIARFGPDEVAVEKVFVNVNPQSTLLLGQARGAAICAAVSRDLPVSEYTALQVKQAVVGNGHAKKEQVQEMVKRLLKLPGYPSPDAADALACAICHAHGGLLGEMSTRVSGQGREIGEMIGRISGVLLEKNPPQVVIDVNGVGYEIDVPMSTFYNLPKLQETVALFTHMVVREDAQLLYGFGTEAERATFRQLLRVSGVGPKVGLAVLSGMSVNDLAEAVAMQESGRLTKVPGIGKKTAERLLLELKDRLKVDVRISVGGEAPAPSSAADILNALISLGYNEKEALFAIKQLPRDASVSDGIRQALKLLSKS